MSNLGCGVALSQPHELACMEIWGGNKKTIARVELPGLAGWVYCRPFQEAGRGGDLYYLSVCDRGILSRIALADVAGHGEAVSGIARKLHELMRESINTWDQTNFMQNLNQHLHQKREDLEYATVSVLGFYRPEGCLAITNAGHHPAAWYHAAEHHWSWIEEAATSECGGIYGLPIGLIPGTNYCQTRVTLGPGDLLVLYTDGIPEAENGVGEQLGRERLLDWLRAAPRDEPEAVGRALLDQLARFRNENPSDDETLIVLQHTG